MALPPVRKIRKLETQEIVLSREAAALPNEFEVILDTGFINMQNINQCGAIRLIPGSDQILCYRTNGTARMLSLDIGYVQQSDAVIAGDRLIVAGIEVGTGINLYEWRITAWSNGLPAQLVAVTNFLFGSTDSRWSRLLVLDSGAVVVSVSRQHDYQQDMLYSPARGVWRDCSPPLQSVTYVTQHVIAQGAAGIVYSVTSRDGLGQFILNRWMEAEGTLQFLGSRVMPLHGFMAPDVEISQQVIQRDPFNPSRILLSYNTVTASINIAEDCEDFYRLCYPVITSLDTITQQPNAPARFRPDYQNLHVTYFKTNNLVFEPQASPDLNNWQALYCPDWTEIPGKVSGIAINPAFSELSPWPSLFLRVQPMTYQPHLVHVVSNYCERATTWLPIFPQSPAVTGYLVQPTSTATCSMTNWFYATTSQPQLVPVDYQPLAWGAGWAFIRRGDKYYLRRMA